MKDNDDCQNKLSNTKQKKEGKRKEKHERIAEKKNLLKTE